MFDGSCVALVTPMTKEGRVDEAIFVELIKWHIDQGTNAIVVTGTTGESPTLTAKEQEKLLVLAIKTANKRIPIIAGTGTNWTQTTIEKSRVAQMLGADACLIVTPYYNRPTQSGLIAHYQAVAAATTLPILLYNVPTRTSCDLLPETVAKLSEIPTIVGIKEATGNIERLTQCQKLCRKDFRYYSGDDVTGFEFMRQGGHGVISITSNVAPKLMQTLCAHVRNKEIEKAQAIEEKLQALHRMLVIEPNPIPVKWALENLGKIHGKLRLPLTSLSTTHHEKVLNALKLAGLN